MKRIAPRALLWLAGMAAAPGSVLAKHPLPGPHYVNCEARGNSVRLSWDHLGIAKEFHRALLHRDGELIAELEPEALSYDDPGVAKGTHAYRLDIVPAADPGAVQVIASNECTVEVLVTSGIQCQVFGGIGPPPNLLITWEPLVVDRPVLRIEVRRDGELAGELAPDALEYSEQPVAGEHLYSVVAILAIIEPVDPPPPNELVVGDCLVNYEPPVIGGFVRADSNGDEAHNLSDPVFTLLFLFGGGPEPPCRKSADTDDTGVIEITDAVYDLNYLFVGGKAPAAPFPKCGHDGTFDELSCDLYPKCFTPPPP
jgi:hypothetical protein